MKQKDVFANNYFIMIICINLFFWQIYVLEL
jgi:hypothetical protein